jgi:hypothetical protein
MAWVAGGVFLIVALVMIPIFLLMPFPEPADGQPQPSKASFIVLLVLYPLFGALWAWIGAQLSARIYNFVARKKGGITFEAARLHDA